MISVEQLQFLVDLALKTSTLVVEVAQLHRFVVTLFFELLQLGRRLARLFLDVGEEFEEVLCVFLEHFFGADETELAHLIEVRESLNLFVFLFEQHLN